jgi:O-acetyl-ADP-ribose deacetylase
MQWEVNGKTLEVVHGDIAAQHDMAAVVNAANAELLTGGGVAGALHRAAGPELAAAGDKYAPISPGEAVITPAFKLPNDGVIHCLGPVYGRDKPEDDLLRSCYEQALDLAEKEKLGSVAFPALSAGAFGYPFEEALDVAVPAVSGKLTALKNVDVVRFVLFSKKEAEIYKDYINRKLA